MHAFTIFLNPKTGDFMSGKDIQDFVSTEKANGVTPDDISILFFFGLLLWLLLNTRMRL